MDKEEKLKKTIEQLIELMPTILIIGSPHTVLEPFLPVLPKKTPISENLTCAAPSST
jgi:hypothetical protein